MSRLVCDVCMEMPCACEENLAAQEILEAKAALFDEMREYLRRCYSAYLWAMDTDHGSAAINAHCEILAEVPSLLKRANKIAEAGK